jgi:hypothetical protein
VCGEGQGTQHLRQGRRAQFCRSASAAGEGGQPDLVSGLHGGFLSILEYESVPIGDDRRGLGERQTNRGIRIRPASYAHCATRYPAALVVLTKPA